jgi:hypothetical protein
MSAAGDLPDWRLDQAQPIEADSQDLALPVVNFSPIWLFA